MKTKPSIIILSSITLFILVLLGVYITNLIAHQEKFAYAESFAQIIVLTGFFIFIISAGLFIYGLIKLINKNK